MSVFEMSAFKMHLIIGLGLGSFNALSSLGEFSRLQREPRSGLEDRILDERIRLLSRGNSAFSDRERIER